MPQLKLTQRQIAILAIGAVILVGVLAVFYFGGQKKSSTSQAAVLSIWGTDNAKAFNNLIAYYTQLNPGSKVTYTQIDPADYDTQLLRAFAAGTGPDIFEIENRSLPKWQSALAPLPTAYYSVFGPLQLQNDFPSIVQSDFMASSTPTTTNIYALPLSIDTLAMFYNKNLLATAGIATPPATWDEFETDVQKLRTLNAGGQLTQAGAAIGGSEASIPEAPDILSLLMLQNGTQMVSPDLSSARFASDANGAGAAAFNFYLQFANPSSPYYTWSDALGNDVQAFVNGQVAMIFGYHSTLSQIQAKAPFMSVGIAPVPQPASATISISYPKFNGLAVYKGSSSVAAAWQFILTLTTSANGESIYTGTTGEPPALLSLISANENDPGLSVFARQALTAQSWYEVDSSAVDGILNNAITSALNGTASSFQALNQAQSAITSLMTQAQHS